MIARIALLLTVSLALLGGWLAGLFELLGDAQRLGALLEGMGAWGFVLYVVSFSLLEPFFVPGILFVLPAAAIWPAWLAFGLSMLGSVGAGIVGFGFARFLAREWVEARIPERFREWDRDLVQQPLRAVILVRLLFFLAPPAHWALGVSQVRFTPFVLGTVIGFTPAIAGITLLGGELVGWLRLQSGATWLAVGIGGAVLWALVRRRRRASRGVLEPPVEPR